VYADSAQTGRWSIVERNGTEHVILRQGNIRVPGKQMIQSVFTTQQRTNLAINILYNGHGMLALDSVKVKRVATMEEPAVTCAQPLSSDHPATPALTLLYPRSDAFITDQTVDFVWQWTGAPLAPNQAFEVRVWHDHDLFHYGAHDAAASRAQVRQIDDTFVLTLDLSGALSVQQHGPGSFFWTVGVVEVTPRYRALGREAPAQRFVLEK
jgi:hypothetical protein